MEIRIYEDFLVVICLNKGPNATSSREESPYIEQYTKAYTNNLRLLVLQIWNCLPEGLESADNLNTFTSLITLWDCPTCNCNACRFFVNIV